MKTKLAHSAASAVIAEDSEDTPAMREEELRALRALRILLESRLIDQLEFERRLATVQNSTRG